MKGVGEKSSEKRGRKKRSEKVKIDKKSKVEIVRERKTKGKEKKTL